MRCPCDLARVILDRKSLASHLLAFVPQGALLALSRCCRLWSREARALAPDASRALAGLMCWPPELEDCGAGQERHMQEQMKLRRRRVLESILMGCQDIDHHRPSPTHAYDGEGAEHEVGSLELADRHCDAASSHSSSEPWQWFCHAAFRDTHMTDIDLWSALGQAAMGDVDKLVLCSSQITDSGLLAACKPHWPALCKLCVSNCGVSGHITKTALAPLAGCSRLETLILIDLADPPLPVICTGAGQLRTLMICGRVSVASVEAISMCSRLETLKLTLRPKLPPGNFIRTFSACQQLQVLDIYGATDVSDQILGCVMLNMPRLEYFSCSHTGSHLSCSNALSGQLVEAFKAHYPGARRMVIENVVNDSLL